MFFYFLQSLVLMPMAQNSDQGLRGRMLALLLLCVHIQKLSADAVDAFVPYFTIHQLSTPGMTDRGMITIHLKGSTCLPRGDDLDALTKKAQQAVETGSFDEVSNVVQRAFAVEDGIPYSVQRGHDFQNIVSSILSVLGGTRTVGRAPTGGAVKKLKGKPSA